MNISVLFCTSALSISSIIPLYWSVTFSISSRSLFSRLFWILASFTMGINSKPNCSINSACNRKYKISINRKRGKIFSAYLVNNFEELPIEIHLETKLTLDENRSAHKFHPSNLLRLDSLLFRGSCPRFLIFVGLKRCFHLGSRIWLNLSFRSHRTSRLCQSDSQTVRKSSTDGLILKKILSPMLGFDITGSAFWRDPWGVDPGDPKSLLFCPFGKWIVCRFFVLFSIFGNVNTPVTNSSLR